MLDIKFIRESPDAVKRAAEVKGIEIDIDELLKCDSQISDINRKLQTLREEKNSITAGIPTLKGADKDEAVEKSRALSEKIGLLDAELKGLRTDYDDMMWRVPNIPAPDVPVGRDDSENVVRYKVDEPRKFDFAPKSHYDLLELNDWADFKRIGKVSGPRAYTLKGAASRLEIALHTYMMDKMAAKGFTMITVPSMVKESALYNAGMFPFGRPEVYHLEKDDIYLSGTAEVALTSLHSDEILEENQLPILYAGYSPCFRREAGAAGKDTRGLIRVHQFMKVEQYVICRADLEESKKWHATLLACAEEVLKDLELPYQVIECCTGDMGAGKYKMNDVETWMPSENRYRETHSCSSLTDWQARRANLRYRENGTNKVRHCFTLNNTGIATPRILAQFLENHQTAEGKVRLPEKIRPYMNGREWL
ncbi:MAG: serine--tRNA ligase [Rickettsiales bacterium]|jgi:seryl-tRNA synthetase|nr:serine--tRNA ligase [Rickettsiales bacterium]